MLGVKVNVKAIRGKDSLCKTSGCNGRPRECTSCRALVHMPFVEMLPSFLTAIAAISSQESTVAVSLSVVRGKPISIQNLYNAFVAKCNRGKKPNGFLQRDFAVAVNAILHGVDYIPPPVQCRSGEFMNFPSIDVMRLNLGRRHGIIFESNVSPKMIKMRLAKIEGMRTDGLLSSHAVLAIRFMVVEAVAIATEAEAEAALPGTNVAAIRKELEGLLHIAVACALHMRGNDGIKASETTDAIFAAFTLFRPSAEESKIRCGNSMWWALLYHACKLRPAFQAVHTAEALISEEANGVTFPDHLSKFNIAEFKNVLATSVALSDRLPPLLRERLLHAYPRAMIAAVADVAIAQTLSPHILCAGLFLGRDSHHEDATRTVAVGLSVALSKGIPVDLAKLCEGITAEKKCVMAQTLRAIGVIKAPLYVAAAMAIVAWDPRVDKGEWEKVVRSIADEVKGEEALGLQAEFFVRNVGVESVRGVMREFEKWSGLK